MKSVGRTVLGVVIGIVGLIGLVLSAGSSGEDLYLAGLFIFGFSLVFIFWLIKRSYDAYEHDPERPRREVKTPAKTAPAPAAMPASQASPRPPASQPKTAPFLSPAVLVWIKGGVLAVIGVVALVVASGAHGGGWAYFGGIFAALACLLAIFRLVSQQFDDPEHPAPLLPVPEDPNARLVRGGLAAIVFVVALVVAAGGHGAGLAYHGGLIAAGCAVLYIFYLIRMSVGAEAHDH